MKDHKVIKDMLMSKLGENPVLSKEILEEIRNKTLVLGEILKEKDYEDILCNIEVELSKIKDPQSVAGIIMYCMSRLPISLQKAILEGQEKIIKVFLTKALTDILLDELKGKQ